MSCSPDGMLRNVVCSAMGPSLLATVHHMTDVLAVHKCATLPEQQNKDFGTTARQIRHTLKVALTTSVLNSKILPVVPSQKSSHLQNLLVNNTWHTLKTLKTSCCYSKECFLYYEFLVIHSLYSAKVLSKIINSYINIIS